MAAKSRDRWRHEFVNHFIPRWPAKFFILIGCGVLHINLWRHNEDSYDVIKITLIPQEEYLLCAKFKFFPWCGFRVTEVQSFSDFPIWLPHHVTYYIIIIIKTFYMSSRTYGENGLSIGEAVAEKKEKIGMDNLNTHNASGNFVSRGIK